MTPARMRQIAGQIERKCVEFRRAISGINVPCEMCRADAEDLRKFALTIPPENPKPVVEEPAQC